jgi:hypothetical protein
VTVTVTMDDLTDTEAALVRGGCRLCSSVTVSSWCSFAYCALTLAASLAGCNTPSHARLRGCCLAGSLTLTLTLALTLPLALTPQCCTCVLTASTRRRSHPLRSRASPAVQYLKPCSVATPSVQWREALVSSTGRQVPVCAVLDRSASWDATCPTVPIMPTPTSHATSCHGVAGCASGCQACDGSGVDLCTACLDGYTLFSSAPSACLSTLTSNLHVVAVVPKMVLACIL